jgi:hypothetical protein
VFVKDDGPFSSVYDPEHPDYIFKEKRKEKTHWNEVVYNCYVYNGNYPEVIRDAIALRGNWKLLNHNALCAIQVKQQKSRS